VEGAIKFDLRCGSALDPSSLAEESIDLIVTSPPYNVGMSYASYSDSLGYEEYLAWSEQWIRNCCRWSRDRGRLCVNVPLDTRKHGKRSIGADITCLAKKAGWKYHTTIIWNKRTISCQAARGSWLSASAHCAIAPVEMLIVLYKNEWKKAHGGVSDIGREEFIAWTNGLWTFNGENHRRVQHPAPFPRELPRRCIKLFSFVGDSVLDPFAGSGTTLIEAINHQRKAYGLEIDKSYIKIARERIKRECGVCKVKRVH